MSLQPTGREISKEQFLQAFDWLIEHELTKILDVGGLSIDEVARINRGETSSFAPLPTNGYTAIYTLNLLLLRTSLSVLNESSLTHNYKFPKNVFRMSTSDGVNGWERLTYLWRSWFSTDILTELGTMLNVVYVEDSILLELKRDAANIDKATPLQKLFYMARALGDDILVGLSGLALHQPGDKNAPQLSQVFSSIEKAGITEDLLHTTLLLGLYRSLRRGNVALTELPEDENKDLMRYKKINRQLSLFQDDSDSPKRTLALVSGETAFYLVLLNKLSSRKLHMKTKSSNLSSTLHFSLDMQDSLLDFLIRNGDSTSFMELYLKEQVFFSIRSNLNDLFKEHDET